VLPLSERHPFIKKGCAGAYISFCRSMSYAYLLPGVDVIRTFGPVIKPLRKASLRSVTDLFNMLSIAGRGSLPSFAGLLRFKMNIRP